MNVRHSESAYEALTLCRTALLQQHQPLHERSNAPLTSGSAATPALTRASYAALIAQLQTASGAYHSHLTPQTSERHERLIHERSRIHVSKVRILDTLSRRLGLSSFDGNAAQAETGRSLTDTVRLGKARVDAKAAQPLPRELTGQLYAALTQLHPVRPAQALPLPATAPPHDPTHPASMGITISAPSINPSPRTSPALATLALTTLANILTSPARSLFALEVFAEHFDLDRGTVGSAGAGTASAGGGGGNTAGATSPSVAVSPAVLAPETADGGRAVSVIMLGGRMLVVDIELGVKEWTAAGAATTPDAPTWVTESGQLSWEPTAHVKVTFANDPSSASAAAKTTEPAGQLSTTSAPPGRQKTTAQDSAASSDRLARDLRRHIGVLAQLLVLGFPLRLDLNSAAADADAPLASTAREADGDVMMQDLGSAPPAANPTPSQLPGAVISEDSSDAAEAMRSVLNLTSGTGRADNLDPALRRIHADLYGVEYFLLAQHHLREYVRVLGRLTQLDFERAAPGQSKDTV